MNNKKVVLRTCVCSKEVCENPEGNVIVDPKGKANGRGAYLKKDKDIILKAKQTKVLDKKLEVSVPESIYDELIGMLNG